MSQDKLLEHLQDKNEDSWVLYQLESRYTSTVKR